MYGQLNGKYKVGAPKQYSSTYGYQKFKYPVIGEDGHERGHIKQEQIIDEAGQSVTTVYYTRDFQRPHGAKRFYSSPEALIIAFGGKIDRVTKLAPVKVGGRAKKIVEPEMEKKAARGKKKVA